MKIVLINKSDSTGGAAVVSRRLMEALRAEGADARMLVVEKLTDSPHVEVAASKWRAAVPFLAERLKIFLRNGFNRKTLFKIDTASDGLPLWKHPLVKDADAILLNWVNQGMLSLKGIDKIIQLGKPVIWTMHDMWPLTGICHHAGECTGYRKGCNVCKLLPKPLLPKVERLSCNVWIKKGAVYGNLWKPQRIFFVAVSNWLAKKVSESFLLSGCEVRVIPNAFPVTGEMRVLTASPEKIRILFGAARLDDSIKNLPALIEMTKVLRSEYPDLAERLELVTFGGVKNPAALDGIAIAHRHLGMVKGEEEVRKVYEDGHILVSSSSYETLPGTLVEAQAYGCIPVSFDQGGQRDIVEPGVTGFIAAYSENPETGGRRLAEKVVEAVGIISDTERYREIIRTMHRNVTERFSAQTVARRYLDLIRELQK